MLCAMRDVAVVGRQSGERSNVNDSFIHLCSGAKFPRSFARVVRKFFELRVSSFSVCDYADW